MAKKRKTKISKTASKAFYSCCISPVGVIHLVAGIGLGLLAASYFSIDNLMLWGWAFLVAGIVMHFMK